jgi:hypothetical protein
MPTIGTPASQRKIGLNIVISCGFVSVSWLRGF